MFHRLKGCFCELIENNRKVPLGEISGTFGGIPVETGEQLNYEGPHYEQYVGPMGPRCQQWQSCNHQWWRGACLGLGTET